MAKAATEDYNIDDDYVSLMQRAARLADYDDYKGAGALHGKKNYVKTLKFLYNCAGYLRKGKGVDKAVKTASSDAGLDTSQKSDSLLVEKVRLLLSEDILSNISESSSKARYFKVMGFAMHVAGDTYAHRTIVPAYTIKGTNPLQKIESASATSETSRFGSDDFVKGLHLAESDAILKTWAFNSTERKEIKTCRIWECFQRTVELGVVEFRDIKHFSINTVGAGAYEDNANFCRERFEEAEYVCYVLFTDSYENYKFDGVYILFPTEKNLKLNNFKNFAKEAGEDISVLTSKEWTQMSTPKEY